MKLNEQETRRCAISGGYFEYNQYRLHDIAQAIKGVIESNEETRFYYSDETLAEFRKAIRYLELAEAYVERVDRLVSADDDEDSFHRRLKKDLAEIGGENE